MPSSLFVFALFLRLIVGLLASSDFDNEIIGAPNVVCERESIKFSVPTKRPFRGRVYVKGEYGNDECIRRYNGNSYGSYQTNRYGSSSQGTFGESEREFQKHRETFVDERNPSYNELGERHGGLEKNFGHGGRNGEVIGDVPGFRSRAGSDFKETFHEKHSSGFTERFGPSFERGGYNSNNPDHGVRPDSTNGFLRAGERGSMSSSSGEFWGSGDRSRLQSGGSINGHECPLVCPPCEKCEEYLKNRHRRQSQENAELEVRLETCNARRDRSRNPPGIHVSFTIVVSFHDSFITKLDRAYHVFCTYEESDHTVTTELDVDMQPTAELTGIIDPPKCTYGIYDLHTGHPVTNVMVGDQVKHEWKCDSAYGNPNVHATYGMLVHNCFIEDGKGEKHMVIDERGCSIPMYDVVISTPIYSTNSLLATIESTVVKFPDRTYLDFQCSIQVCIKPEGQCDGITPPNCSKRPRRELMARLNKTQNDWKIYAKRLTVFDLDEKIDNEDQFNSMLAITGELSLLNQFCISIAGFGVLVSAFTFLATITLSALIGFIIMRNYEKPNRKF
uniref:ZP domain-containing protein n=1 Tax=Acrobeloides nanus TaxID=290746 RepID=A0A914C4N8_9BILA